MDIFVIIGLGFAVFVTLALCRIFWEAHRSSILISEWANTHDYKVVEKKQPVVNLGPFRWEMPHGRTFYHITVRSQDGQTRSGWVSCGAEWLGLFANRIEIRWDKSEPSEAVSKADPVDGTVWPPPPTG